MVKCLLAVVCLIPCSLTVVISSSYHKFTVFCFVGCSLCRVKYWPELERIFLLPQLLILFCSNINFLCDSTTMAVNKKCHSREPFSHTHRSVATWMKKMKLFSQYDQQAWRKINRKSLFFLRKLKINFFFVLFALPQRYNNTNACATSPKCTSLDWSSSSNQVGNICHKMHIISTKKFQSTRKLRRILSSFSRFFFFYFRWNQFSQRILRPSTLNNFRELS